jgi:hypothetical protein
MPISGILTGLGLHTADRGIAESRLNSNVRENKPPSYEQALKYTKKDSEKDKRNPPPSYKKATQNFR